MRTATRFAAILLMMLLDCNALFAQKPNQSDTGRNLIIVIAYHSGISRSYELSAAKGHSVSTGGYPGFFMQYGGGAEVFQHKSDIAFAPKIFYELDPFLPPMCFSRISLMYITDLKGNGSLKYRHEIGFSCEGSWNINYGYTFNLTNKSFFRTTHSLNLQWNIFAGKRKWENIRE